MLPVKQAESIILDSVQSLDPELDTEVAELSSATGRILASSVTSQLDFPHWDNSAMDGYAVRYIDVQFCHSQQPAILDIVAEIPAGYQPQVSIQSGEAARIFTGGVMPEGADTVVMQEDTKREENRVFIFQSPKPQACVRHRASFYHAGEPLLNPGIVLNAPEIAILAAAQCTELTVYRRPKVAILSTGDELVTPDQPLQPGQIVDSNQYALAAWVRLCGGIPKVRGIVGDNPEKLKNAIAEAILAADIVLSTGGVSVGDYDYVDRILAELGAEIHIHSVAIKPGKPLTFATLPPSLTASSIQGHKQRSHHPVLYFGIPGNPVSALVSCWRFVQPALRKLSGLPPELWEPMFVNAIAIQDLHGDGRKECYLSGRLRLVKGGYEFELAGGSHSSGNLINLAQTTGLAVVPVGQTFIPAGESVQVLIVDS
ncbi:MAG TPA: molybdopterin molybdenumtransferase [Cyanobacteria bacterium UBA11149]|nr:molybdopterin molybdenumtransferase [Cyanobacteria bacterium UBA11367]HBE60323.1 molybdopterin molybdenumtransferase [Cyanobacteria bacterium UBA11366]HBR72639.1 molybdopterin molybdenumtransferase [Cyanobacteria bacterium UBA11159]HBS68756.1 molybdopterin molybdenumtransferase [Cyanobacteria bacterium UBA11153]HBW89086.1 molybdopterin molybdenumtransferase [Cyanobacteria bacterium UBA11149]HCA98139.1 molybdopterin molybdenumtransferase [Cyanobacteria bacterium UBA9226]